MSSTNEKISNASAAVNNNSTKTMGYNIDWIIPHLRKPTRFWRIASTITVAAVGIFSKIFIFWFNKPKIHNNKRLISSVQNRPSNVPLITVSNHHSCFDDPGLWATLEWRQILKTRCMRWSLAAHDICFTQASHSYFFMLGKCVPVVRGAGVHQPAVDFCIERLASGDWVHVFPEGKVNMTKEDLRLKWGVGRMIYESPVTPIILPIWHIGMENALPNYPPYYLRTGNPITYNYGSPLDLSALVARLRKEGVSDVEARRQITDEIQVELRRLQKETEGLHAQHFGLDANNSALGSNISSVSTDGKTTAGCCAR